MTHVRLWRLAALFLALQLGQTNLVYGQGIEHQIAAFRALHVNKRPVAASDFAADSNFASGVGSFESKVAEAVLWDVADAHLAAANTFTAGADNDYAQRAILAWKEYVDFAVDKGMSSRLHKAVEFLQRSYIQARALEAMSTEISQIPPLFVNHNVVTRWEDRLRMCPTNGEPDSRSWNSSDCAKLQCRSLVSTFHGFLEKWLHDFPLKDPARRSFSNRAAGIPAECRSKVK